MSSSGLVFFGNAKSVFVSRTVSCLAKKNIEIDIYDLCKGEVKGKGPIRNLFFRIKEVFFFLYALKKAKTAVIHCLSYDVVWLAPLLRLRFQRVVIIAYGSDVLRRNRKFDFFLKFGLLFVSRFYATNQNILDAAVFSFPIVRDRSGIIRFGLPVFDAIDKFVAEGIDSSKAKSLLGLDCKKDLICLGYSASSGQRQRELMNFFCANDMRKFSFLVPAQYGEPDVIQDLCNFHSESVCVNDIFVLTEFYDVDKIALLRLATSVLLNHSVTDAFSGTVQETVYAGGLVLAVENLPYENMPGYDSAIKSYEQLDDVMHFFESPTYEEWKLEAKKFRDYNVHALHETSSWSGVLEDWKRLLGMNQ